MIDSLAEVTTRPGYCHRQSLLHNLEGAIITWYTNLKLITDEKTHGSAGI